MEKRFIVFVLLSIIGLIIYQNYVPLYEINPCRKIGEREVYFVKCGDCINDIAASYNILPKQLREANGMKPGESLIRVNQRLIIPRIEWMTHYGYASWYGPGFHGRKMANGQAFDQYGMSAAHKKLPLNSIIRVVNLLNGLSVTVPVSDRGPYIEDRIVDLSYGAARALKMVKAGVVPVEVIPLPN